MQPQHPQIIVADDDPAVLSFVQLLIKRALPSAVVRPFSSGEAAWEQIQLGKTDLLITDCKMLGMDGPELVRNLRAAQFRFPVIMISGSPECQRLGEEAGIDYFFEKTRLTRELSPLLADLFAFAI
jgi:CheY-like chemotaxis protein